MGLAVCIYGCLAIHVLLNSILSSEAATIGDGSVSLITGRAINLTDTRGGCQVGEDFYFSGTAVPRKNPCHYCICYRGKVDCYWKNCGPAPASCDVLLYEGVCDPSLYICPIPEKAREAPNYIGITDYVDLNVRPQRKRSVSMTSLRLPVDEPFPIKFDEEFVTRLEHSLRQRRSISTGAAISGQNFGPVIPLDKSCKILGIRYEVGEIIGVATGACMECRCAAQTMYCSPKCCFEPAKPELEPKFLQRSDDDYRRKPIQPHPLYYVRTEFDYGF